MVELVRQWARSSLSAAGCSIGSCSADIGKMVVLVRRSIACTAVGSRSRCHGELGLFQRAALDVVAHNAWGEVLEQNAASVILVVVRGVVDFCDGSRGDLRCGFEVEEDFALVQRQNARLSTLVLIASY